MTSLAILENLITESFDVCVDIYRKDHANVRKGTGYTGIVWSEATFVANYFRILKDKTDKYQDIMILVAPTVTLRGGKVQVPDLIIAKDFGFEIIMEFKIYPNQKSARADINKLIRFKKYGVLGGYFLHIDHQIKIFGSRAAAGKGFLHEIAANKTRTLSKHY